MTLRSVSNHSKSVILEVPNRELGLNLWVTLSSLLQLVNGPVGSLVDLLLGSSKVESLDTSNGSRSSGLDDSSRSLSSQERHGSLGDGGLSSRSSERICGCS